MASLTKSFVSPEIVLLQKSKPFKPAALDKSIHEPVCCKRKRKKLGTWQQHDEVNQLKRTVELLEYATVHSTESATYARTSSAAGSRAAT